MGNVFSHLSHIMDSVRSSSHKLTIWQNMAPYQFHIIIQPSHAIPIFASDMAQTFQYQNFQYHSKDPSFKILERSFKDLNCIFKDLNKDLFKITQRILLRSLKDPQRSFKDLNCIFKDLNEDLFQMTHRIFLRSLKILQRS